MLCSNAALQQNSIGLVRLGLAIAVLYSHCYPTVLGSLESEEPLFRLSRGQKTLGSVSVDLFFAISGLLIAKSWAQSNSAASYLKKRVLRIHPAYIAYSFFGLLLAATTVPSPTRFLSQVPWTKFIAVPQEFVIAV